MLELVVAVGIFATAFLLLLGVFPTATRAIRQANEYLTASYLAEQEIELVRAMDYDAIVAVSPRDVTVQTTNRGITVDTRYTIEVDVSEIDPKNPDQILIGSGLKRIRVLVSWTHEQIRKLEVSTYVADY